MEIASFSVSENYLAKRGDSYANAKEILALMALYRGRHQVDKAIADIYLIGVNGVGISEREGVFDIPGEFDALQPAQRLLSLDNHPAIVQFSRRDLSGYWSRPAWQANGVGSEPQLGLARIIYDPVRKDRLGLVVIEINSAQIAQIIADPSKAGDMTFFIFDAEGNTLFGDARQEDNAEWPQVWRQARGRRGQFVHELGGRDVFFVYNTSALTDWRVMGEVDMHLLMRKAYNIRNITIANVVGCVLVTMLLYYLISARLTKPIKTLQDKMRLAAQGDMEARFHSRNRDEIADLGESFNIMLERIDKLMQQTRREQENLKRAEFRALQAQINPHFLYNTLDAIIWMSQASRHEEVMELVVALSRFFRLTLANGREMVTVADELDHAQNYLIIQTMRYPDILNYEFAVDPRLRRFQMIKPTLQPLIENAIYHGLKTKRGGGTVWIEGDYDEDKKEVVFMVRDNGSGMEAGRLREVRQELQRSGSQFAESEGYALRNVNERIQLFYGREYGLAISSEPDKGTVATMTFPAVEPNNVENISG